MLTRLEYISPSSVNRAKYIRSGETTAIYCIMILGIGVIPYLEYSRMHRSQWRFHKLLFITFKLNLLLVEAI